MTREQQPDYGQKAYLGDGVYVDTEYEDVVLTTENGVEATNRIVLEWPVYDALVAYVNRWRPAA